MFSFSLQRNITFVGILLLTVLCKRTGAFTSSRAFYVSPIRTKHTQQLRLSFDPSPFASDVVVVDAVANSDTLIGPINLQTFLLQSIYLKPAMEHMQPLWGPPDPYLAAGKSIAPSSTALTDMGIADQLQTDGWSELARNMVQRGTVMIDKANIKAASVLPGFTPTGSLLSTHSPYLPTESTPATFAATVEWASGFINILDKLPEAAFAYALVEFFILRPGIDLYKEDVEEDPTRAFADALAVTGVRLSMFCVVAIVTAGVFG
jgi:hypothetical protein